MCHLPERLEDAALLEIDLGIVPRQLSLRPPVGSVPCEAGSVGLSPAVQQQEIVLACVIPVENLKSTDLVVALI